MTCLRKKQNSSILLFWVSIFGAEGLYFMKIGSLCGLYFYELRSLSGLVDGDELYTLARVE